METPRLGLLSLPIEVQISILQSCGSYTQALSLVTTCRQLYDLWTTCSTSIVSYIGRNSIPSFDDALIAVRATTHAAEYYTHLVHTAKSLPTGSPPPPSRVSIKQLSSSTTGKATTAEAKSVLNLKLFVDYSLYLSHTPPPATHLACLTQRSTYIPLHTPCSWREFFTPQGKHYNHYPIANTQITSTSAIIVGEGTGGTTQQQQPQEHQQQHVVDEEEGLRIEARVYTGMYRLFTISALLTNRYYEPFFTDDPIAKRLREAYAIYWPREVKEDPAAVVDPGMGIIPEEYRDFFAPIRRLQEDEIEYLMGWEVFNKKKFREGKEGGLVDEFEELAEYFCGKARRVAVCDDKKRKRRRSSRGSTSSSSSSPQLGSLSPIPENSGGVMMMMNTNNKGEFDLGTAAEIQELMILNNCYEVWMRMRERMDSLLEPVRLTHEKLLYGLYKNKVRLVTIPVVFHAIYGVGDAMMPQTVEEFMAHPYGPVPPNLQGLDNDGNPLKHVEVSDVIYQLVGAVGQELWEGGLQGKTGGYPVGGDSSKAYFEFGWPEYAFWEWAMKKRFGLRVEWKWAYLDGRYDEFVREGRAFTMRPADFKKEIPGVLGRCRIGEKKTGKAY
ncbi:hypothetical protein H072_10996 [Dactylellina haptotyla CBS 200.50]|uniref:F-box domain-containing protein n=1 Tax=Dactylellina haptotyla (strain CBS 200.50) TaxID=1284197 RepID=S8A398_DACHA|nr:hypothetical protein H072_10996 [Dactylellina haptotyla CBS 200.50]